MPPSARMLRSRAPDASSTSTDQRCRPCSGWMTFVRSWDGAGVPATLPHRRPHSRSCRPDLVRSHERGLKKGRRTLRASCSRPGVAGRYTVAMLPRRQGSLQRKQRNDSRMAGRLPYEECLQRLREHTVGRIAVVIHYAPVVLPVNYRLVETGTSRFSQCAPVLTTSSKAEDQRLRSRSTKSIRSNSRAGPCSCGEPCTDSTHKQPISRTASIPTLGSSPSVTPGSSSNPRLSPAADCIPRPTNRPSTTTA